MTRLYFLTALTLTSLAPDLANADSGEWEFQLGDSLLSGHTLSIIPATGGVTAIGGVDPVGVDGLCDADRISDGVFIFGQTVYFEVKAKRGSDTFSSTTTGTTSKQSIAADLDTVISLGDDAAPRDLDIALIWSESRQAFMPQVTWTWIDSDEAASDLSTQDWA